jgi:hypothetical protein
VSLLGERLLAVHDALTAAGRAHAFGGAIALAYCTGEPRGTRDLDVNIFAAPAIAREVLADLPSDVTVGERDIEAAQGEGQVRVWWDETPIDVFLDLHPFHAEIAAHTRIVPFEGREIPVLRCTDLAVFKALLDRTKDWADIEEMVAEGTLDVPRVQSWLRQISGAAAPGIARLQKLAGQGRELA